MKDITSYKTPSPALWRINNWQKIWMSFEKTPHTCFEHLQQPPSPPHLQFRSAKTRCARASGSRKGKNHQAQTMSHQPVWNPVLTSWPPSSQNLQQITGTVRSRFMLQTLHHPPHPKEIQNYICGHEVIWKTGAGPPEGHHWTLAGSSSVCIQSKQVCGRCSQHGTALCSATSRQTRGLGEDPVCGLQLVL